MLVCQLDTKLSHLEEGTYVEELPPSNSAMDTSVDIFLTVN